MFDVWYGYDYLEFFNIYNMAGLPWSVCLMHDMGMVSGVVYDNVVL